MFSEDVFLPPPTYGSLTQPSHQQHQQHPIISSHHHSPLLSPSSPLSPNTATATTTATTTTATIASATTTSSTISAASSSTSTHTSNDNKRDKEYQQQQQASIIFPFVHSIVHKCLILLSTYLPSSKLRNKLFSTSSSSSSSSTSSTSSTLTTHTNAHHTTTNTIPISKSITCTKWLIWLMGKWIQIWAIFHLYYLLTDVDVETRKHVVDLDIIRHNVNDQRNYNFEHNAASTSLFSFLYRFFNRVQASIQYHDDELIDGTQLGLDTMSSSTIERVTVQQLRTVVIAFAVLLGGTVSWLVMEMKHVKRWYHHVRFASKMLIPTEVDSHHHGRDDRDDDNGGHVMIKDWSMAQMMRMLRGLAPKLMFHSLWISVSTLFWLYALRELTYPRVVMLQYLEPCIVIVLGSALGWKSALAPSSSSSTSSSLASSYFSRNFGGFQWMHIPMMLWCTVIMIARPRSIEDTEELSWFERLMLMNQRTTWHQLWEKGFYCGLLLIAMTCTVLRKNHAKRLASDLRRVKLDRWIPIPGVAYWITILTAGLLLLPWITISILFNLRDSLQWISLFHFIRTLLFGACVLTVPYYVERLCQVSYHPHIPSSSGAASTAASHNSNTGSSNYDQPIIPHLYWRIVLTFFMLTLGFWGFSWGTTGASLILLKVIYDVTVNQSDRYIPFTMMMNNGMGGGVLGGKVKKSGLDQFLIRLRNGIVVYLQFIMSNRDSRYLFIFLLANLGFMFVELLYGIWSNSLGLISDSAHMLFDCAALGIGLYGAFMSKWKRNQTYTYGYSRYEYLSGFVNGLLLVFISIYIFIEAVHRVLDPPVVDTNRLLLVSILGFLINLMGVVFFHDHSGHGHDDENMHGVYLHILADALGSIGVIASTLIMQVYGWYLADPICSLMISILILMASYPLLANSIAVLMQRSPSNLDHKISKTIDKVKQMPGVIDVSNAHFWTMSSGFHIGSIHVTIQAQVNEQEILASVSALFEEKCSIKDMTIQIEKNLSN